MQGHVIEEVEHWTPFGEPSRMFAITFAYDDEEHRMLCCEINDEIYLSHDEMLDSGSHMDEIVMESMAEKFIDNCAGYFHDR